MTSFWSGLWSNWNNWESLGQPLQYKYELLKKQLQGCQNLTWYGERLKAAGVSKDDRRDLLGHKNGDVTDLYCAKELNRMLENTNKVTQEKSNLILWKRSV